MSAQESSSLVLVEDPPKPKIPYLHKHYWEFVLDLEARCAKRLFDIDSAEDERLKKLFGPTPKAIVRTSQINAQDATLWVDGRIREVFRGETAWTRAVAEANRINAWSQEHSSESNPA
jgi:hypothetical protein